MGMFDDLPNVGESKPSSSPSKKIQFDDLPNVAKPVAPVSPSEAKQAAWYDSLLSGTADVGKSVASGATEGATAIPGTPGSILGYADQVRRGIDVLGRKAGFQMRPSFSLLDASRLPTSEETVSKATQMGLSYPYEPKTTLGTYAKSVGGVLPYAALGGAGALAREASLATAASRVGLEALGAGVGSGGAGQLTKDTALEGPARFAGMALGGMAGAGIRNVRSGNLMGVDNMYMPLIF